MSDFLRNAMGEHEKIIEEIRQRHIVLACGEERGRMNKAMSEVKSIHFHTLGLLGEEMRKTSELRNLISTWTTVFKSMVDDLKKKDELMEEKYKSVWLNEDRFCTSTEKTIRQLEKLWKRSKILHDDEMEALIQEIMTHLKRLEKLLHQKDDAVDQIHNEMIEREKCEQKDSLDDEELQEMTRNLVGRIPYICAEYQEVENEILHTREIISEKTAQLLKQAKKKNLYSIVNLNDVKKSAPFKTTPKPSNP